MPQHILFPAEWETQSAVQLTWPHEGTDWAEMLDEVTDCFVDIARRIAEHERVLVAGPDEDAVRDRLGDLNGKLLFCCMETNDTWARDHAPIAVIADGRPAVSDFCFNGWGLRYAANHDNRIARTLFEKGIFRRAVAYLNCQQFVLEGGSIDTDGRGTIMTTAGCLTSDNRNNSMRACIVERRFKAFFGAERVLWLKKGFIAGDDTDGHVDMLARFCDERTIAYVKWTKKDELHYRGLSAMERQLKTFVDYRGEPYRLIPLPMPEEIFYRGKRLPASYANFLIINDAVLVPVYGCAQDATALSALRGAFPDREVIAVNCRVLLRQGGSLHCVTMQYPKGWI